MLESKLSEASRQVAHDVYNDELLNMREVLENFKHRQKWRPLSSGGNKKGGERKDRAGFSPGLDESDDLGSLAIQHHSVTEIVRFVTEMTDLCVTMDKKKFEIDFYDSCIRDINEERTTFSSTDETERLRCYTVARNNALNFVNICRIFSVIKFIQSRNTNAFEGNMVENSLDTLYSMDDEKSQVNALRDTVQNVLAKGVEQLRQTEVDLYKDSIERASKFYKYETTPPEAAVVAAPPPPTPPITEVLSTFAELPESNMNIKHALSTWHHQ